MRHRGAALLDRRFEVGQGLRQQRLRAGPLRPLLAAFETRERQQVVDQRPQPARGAVDDRDQLVAAGAELALEVLAQELRIALHHADRLLELVGGHGGELLDVLGALAVPGGAPELRRFLRFLRLPGQLPFRLPAGGDVLDQPVHPHPLGVPHERAHHLDPESAPVRPLQPDLRHTRPGSGPSHRGGDEGDEVEPGGVLQALDAQDAQEPGAGVQQAPLGRGAEDRHLGRSEEPVRPRRAGGGAELVPVERRPHRQRQPQEAGGSLAENLVHPQPHRPQAEVLPGGFVPRLDTAHETPARRDHLSRVRNDVAVELDLPQLGPQPGRRRARP